MNRIIIISLVLINSFVLCTKVDTLGDVKLLMQAKEYDKAIHQLDIILQDNIKNIEANELRIRATMLRKSTIRNHKKKPDVSSNKRDGAVSHNPACSHATKKGGFSIMSLCNDKDPKALTHIQQKLSTKKVN